MPEENKIKQEDPKVDLDVSGPAVDISYQRTKKRLLNKVPRNKKQLKK